MTLALPAPSPRRLRTARLATLGSTAFATAVTTAEYASKASRSSGITASAWQRLPVCPSSPSAEPLALPTGRQDQLTHPRRISLTAGGFHHRTDDRARRGHLAAADLLRHVGIGGKGFVDSGLRHRVVAHQLQTAGGHHLFGFALPGQHALDDLAGQLVGQLPLV